MKQPYIAGIGGANVDLHGQSLAPFVMRDSNPGTLHLSMGGVMRNILDNLCRLGQRCELISAVGDDAYGQMLKSGCEALGIGTKGLITRCGHTSSSYISILDNEGDMLMAMSDMRVLNTLNEEFVAQHLALLNGAKIVVCDGNLSFEALQHLANHCTAPLYCDPVSTAWAKKIKPIVGRFDTIKPNRMEMEVLADMPIHTEADLGTACCRLLRQGVRRVFVSLGAEGIYYKGTSTTLHRRSRPFDKITNATGAGDATMAAIVHASCCGFDEVTTLNFALGAGLVALAGADTINPTMSDKAVHAMIKEYIQ